MSYRKIIITILAVLVFAGICAYYFLFFRTFRTPEELNGPIGSFNGEISDVALFNVRYPFGIVMPKTGVIMMKSTAPLLGVPADFIVEIDRGTKLFNEKGELVNFSSLKTFFQKGFNAKATGVYTNDYDTSGHIRYHIYASKVEIVNIPINE